MEFILSVQFEDFCRKKSSRTIEIETRSIFTTLKEDKQAQNVYNNSLNK